MQVAYTQELPPQRLIHPDEEARGLLGGISRTQLWRLKSEGELDTVRIGRRTFVTAESIRAYIERQTQVRA